MHDHRELSARRYAVLNVVEEWDGQEVHELILSLVQEMDENVFMTLERARDKWLKSIVSIE